MRKRAVHWRFPNGFVGPECANKHPLSPGEGGYVCGNAMHCRHNRCWLTGNTIFCKHQAPTDRVVSAMQLLSQTNHRFVMMELLVASRVSHDIPA